MYMVLRYRKKKQRWEACGDTPRMQYAAAQSLLKRLRAAFPDEVYLLVIEQTGLMA